MSLTTTGKKLPKPIVFVGSSAQNLPLAYAIQANLENDADVIVWSQGVFALGCPSLTALEKQLRISDFGVFIFAPDDVAIMLDQKHKVARDNVVFELGLFMGRLGSERCYIVQPASPEVHLPTDLSGITVAFYDLTHAGGVQAALGGPCNKIRDRIVDLGCYSDEAHVPSSGQKDTVVNNTGLVSEGMEIFIKDDAGYATWLKAHQGGFVVNSFAPPRASYLALHRSTCSFIQPSHGKTMTAGSYSKICAKDWQSLETFAGELGGILVPCGRCKPDQSNR